MYSIWTITVRCYPLVSELTGNPHSKDSSQARFSAMRGVAATPDERRPRDNRQQRIHLP
ncbi:hypothetical protein [Caballeronia udeis]|uniref:hypothetical protein n=1 Tax=Caballeronia udeis TaxID=1232866 RepID=UPI000AF6F5EA|nr:hypothetical protein [Caballeronia udeis]